MSKNDPAGSFFLCCIATFCGFFIAIILRICQEEKLLPLLRFSLKHKLFEYLL